MVSIQNAGVLSACLGVNSGSSSSTGRSPSDVDSSILIVLGSPSGVSPMSSGRVRMTLAAGPMMISSSTPMPSAAPSNPKLSIASASSGTSRPPR